MKIEIKPPYVPFSQHAYCCVPTCMQMIMYRRGIPLISQEDIGYEFGLIVPKKNKKMFNKVRTGPRPGAGYGTRVNLKIYSIDKFLKKHKIKLKIKEFEINTVENIKKIIVDNLKKDNDLMVYYDYRKLWSNGTSTGHVSLISSFDTKKNIITLIDPEKNVPKYRETTLRRLVNAIKYHVTNSIVIFESR